jgi:hypothetical protein
MSPSRVAAGRRRAARVFIALAAASACIGAVVAYAATRPNGVQQGLGEQRAVQQPSGSDPGGPVGKDVPPSLERLLRPRLIEVPPETTTASEVQFRFHVQPRTPPPASPPPADPAQPAPVETSSRRFQCRVDGEKWSDCRSPYGLTDLAPGSHHFVVRALNREERTGEPAAFDWRQTTVPALAAQEVAAPPAPAAPAPSEAVEPQRFSVEALRDPADLYPGLAPLPIPVRVTNPNDVAIEVTALTAAIGEAPATCTAENFELTPAALSPDAPLVVPANGSADLPSAGLQAPAIRMLNLPVEQDACRGVEIPLVFSGEAQG